MFKNLKEVYEVMETKSHLIVKEWFYNQNKNEFEKLGDKFFVEKETEKAILIKNKEEVKLWIPIKQIVSIRYIGIMNIDNFLIAEDLKWTNKK